MVFMHRRTVELGGVPRAAPYLLPPVRPTGTL
jgi:hypothetical protein